MSVADALDEVTGALTAAGLSATRDPGAFYPSPIGCLVGMPRVQMSGLSYMTLEVPVHVVCSDPPSVGSVDALYSAAGIAANALMTADIEPREWSGGPNAESLPSLLITATVSVDLSDAPEPTP